jgi:putative peptidoglycan lipid II flippase
MIKDDQLQNVPTNKPLMKHIARSTLIIAVFFGLEKALGFVRNILISRTFADQPELLDAFNAANNIPDLLFALISGGALAMALIPVLSEYLETKNRSLAWDLFSRIANLVFLVTLGFSIIIAIFADQLVASNVGIAPGFGPEQQALVADLMRLNLIATMLFSLAGLVIAGLQANQHFVLPALAPSMYDIGALVGILILVPETPIQLGPITLPALGLGIHGLVYGTILGAAMFLGVQIPGLFHYGFRWTPKIDLRHPGVQQVLVVLGPRVLTVFFIQFIFIVQDNIASRLVEGSVTALVYGWLFAQVPQSLIGTAIGTALLPTISEHVSRKDFVAFKATVNNSLKVILALTIPLTAILIVGIHPVIPILGFDDSMSEMIVWITRAYLLGIVGLSIQELTARAYYAQQDARTPLFTIIGTAIGFTALAALFATTLNLGAPGIALANTTAFTLQALVMVWLLNRKYPGLAQLRGTLLRVLLVAAGASALVYLALNLLPLASMSLIVSIIVTGAVLGGTILLCVPFIWPEIKLLLKM